MVNVLSTKQRKRPVLVSRFTMRDKAGWHSNEFVKISFLSPAYNSAGRIITMLDSIPKNYAHEIIVYDNASTDQTLKLCKQYQKRCPQLKIISNASNTGTLECYDQLIQAATGDYIAIINSNDMYFPKIRKVLAQVNGDYDIYYYNVMTKDERLIRVLPNDRGRDCWPAQFQIIRKSYFRDIVFSSAYDGAMNLSFNKSLVDKNPHCKYTDITAYWYNYPRVHSARDVHVRDFNNSNKYHR